MSNKSKEQANERRARILVLTIVAALVLGCALFMAALCDGYGILSCIG